MRRVNLLPAVILLLLALPLASLAEDSKGVAFIKGVKGKVELKRGGSPEWKDARVGDVLNSGDWVRTGINSMAMIMFTDKLSIVKLRDETEVEIRGQRKEKSLSKKLYTELGDIWAEVKDPTGGFEIETPTSVASVKGTEWIETVSGDTVSVYGIKGLVILMNLISLAQVEIGPDQVGISIGSGIPTVQDDPEGVKRRRVEFEEAKEQSLIFEMEDPGTHEKRRYELKFKEKE